MPEHLSLTAIVVHDYDEAITFFVGKLGFELREDTRLNEALKGRGVRFLEAPRREPYGTVAIFEDLYGNRWDLIERTPEVRSAALAPWRARALCS